jgi:hypothetical protein
MRKVSEAFMRTAIAIFLLVGVGALAQEPAKLDRRFGIDSDLVTYPQGAPKEAMQSVIKAINNERLDYLMAHLADPKFVDGKVREYGVFFKGADEAARDQLAFQRLVREIGDHFANDPVAVKELRRFAEGADFEVMDSKATGFLKTIPTRKVFMRQVGGRWFMEDRQK